MMHSTLAAMRWSWAATSGSAHASLLGFGDEEVEARKNLTRRPVLWRDEHTRRQFPGPMIRSKVPETVGTDVISVSELTQKLFADAKAVGIGSSEIEEDVGSVYEAIFDAIVHYDAGLADRSALPISGRCQPIASINAAGKS
ncbi:DUF768 domain-containing protein [Mesorhizobium sp. BHbdii]